ncbi:MAG: ATP-binding protein [Saprospiraceae bacterium]
METLIGRKKEAQQLRKMFDSPKSEFVAVYGRRRVGKTFLIREVFKKEMTFEMTGIANVDTSDQLSEFYAELKAQAPKELTLSAPKTWFDAFRLLRTVLEQPTEHKKKVVFLDELPWMDTPRSKFIPALEHFWNAWASARKDILLIVCGSAASWMIKNLLNNRGGLHNRVTHRIKLEPFNLNETESFLERQGFRIDRYQIVQLYMVFGGIPFYLEKLDAGQSALQNINRACFERGAPFRYEFENLYGSLFKNADNHIRIIEALSTKNKGLTREEIIQASGVTNGGGLNRIINELEESSFIRKYRSFGKKEKIAYTN